MPEGRGIYSSSVILNRRQNAVGSQSSPFAVFSPSVVIGEITIPLQRINTMRRRTFLIHTFSSALGGLSLAKSNLPASIPKKRKLSRIGLQLYTVRRELEKDFAGTLAQVAALGFSEVE